MTDTVNRVILDSDFCNMIAPGKDVSKDTQFVKSIFESLGYKPFVHTFVLKQELLSNSAIRDLSEDGYIGEIKYGDIFTEEWQKDQYVDVFVDCYGYMNSERIRADFKAIISHRVKKNMGEIHSLVTAQFLNIPIFMSNDAGARKLAENKINTQDFSLEIKNVCDVLCDIKRHGLVQLDKKAVRSILKSRPGWSEAYSLVE